MTDTYTETTTKGWSTRIGESIKGILFGIVLIGLSCMLLFWNEGRAVQTTKSLNEGAGLVVDVGTGSVDPANGLYSGAGAPAACVLLIGSRR